MAGKIVNKFMDFIGLEEEYEEEEEFYDDEEELEERPVRKRERAPRVKKEQEPRRSEKVERPLRSVQSQQRNDEPILFTERKRKNKEQQNGGSSSVKLVVYKPKTYNDSQDIIDNLVANKPIIVNLMDLNGEKMQQRVLDFMSGAAYAVNGSVMPVADGIFLLAPNNVDILGNLDENVRTNDFFNMTAMTEEY